ncbi:hypothetical protein ACIQU4_39890 [Streptomyces sp. NPDC090741]|uniref:hypothetical protein n=1 Tax=Streptomyces sp. NPDC090741 TaxID=3365967 RepID=UPI00380B9FC6
MNHDAPPPAPSAPPRRARRTVLLGLAVLGLARAPFAVRGPLMMSAPRCTAGRWHGCFGTFNGVVLMTLVALPLAALAAWALARRRRPAGVTSAWRMSLAEVGMVHGTVPFVWPAMMPGAGAGAVPARVSPVPLRNLVTTAPRHALGTLWPKGGAAAGRDRPSGRCDQDDGEPGVDGPQGGPAGIGGRRACSPR